MKVENKIESGENPTLSQEKIDNVEEKQHKENVDNKTAFNNIKYKVVHFIDAHQYSSIAVGTGILIGGFLLIKHYIKNRRK